MSSKPNIAPAIEFAAPWSRQLTFITLLTSVLLLGIGIILWLKAPENPPLMYRLSIWICPAVLLLSALFAVRGYRLEGRNLWVLRPGWKTRIALDAMTSASFEPNATKGSIRLFGNGGFFAFSGLFRNQKLGRYRAFATDMAHTVVIHFPARTLVVTPEKPEQFLEILNGHVATRTM